MSCSMPQGHPSHCGCPTTPSIERSFIKSDKRSPELQLQDPRKLSEERIADLMDMSRTNPTAAKHHKVQGKVCKKHPELKGLRYATSRSCLGCREDRRLQRMADLKRIPALEDRIKDLEAQLLETQQAAKAVLDAQNREDDSPHGYPSHEHRVPGKWDKDGSTCTSCEAYFKLEALMPAGHRGPSPVVTPMLSDWLIRTPTTANLLLAAETFFEPGLVTVINDIAHIKYGLGVTVWAPTCDMEHALHLAGKINAAIYYDKGVQVSYTAPDGTVKTERVIEQWLGEGKERALMRKIAQIAIYLAKCHKNRA